MESKKRTKKTSWILPEFKIWSFTVSGIKLLEMKLHTRINYQTQFVTKHACDAENFFYIAFKR